MRQIFDDLHLCYTVVAPHHKDIYEINTRTDHLQES